jgi:hypothetical protein
MAALPGYRLQEPNGIQIMSRYLDFYNFPLVAALREVFGFGGNLALLKEAQGMGRALPGVKAVTFVRNNDIDRPV